MSMRPKEVERVNGQARIVRFEVHGIEVNCYRRGSRGIEVHKSKLGAQVYDPKELVLPNGLERKIRKIAGGILYESRPQELELPREPAQLLLFQKGNV